MKEKTLRILIPVVALVVVVESILFLTKTMGKTAVQPEVVVSKPITLKWDDSVNNQIALTMTSDKDVAIDAVDLYIKYDPTMASVTSLMPNKSFAAPSFSKISTEKGMVVINYLVSEATGYQLKANSSVELARFNVNYLKNGSPEFSIGDGTLVVENATAKVLPFNSDKLVINVSR